MPSAIELGPNEASGIDVVDGRCLEAIIYSLLGCRGLGRLSSDRVVCNCLIVVRLRSN